VNTQCACLRQTLCRLFLASTFFILTAWNPAFAAKRALVIGISDYKNVTKLENPRVDVANVSAKLATAGYIVTAIRDPDTTRARLIDAFDKFLKSIKQGDEVLVYYSGHGIDVRGTNMFVPADSPANEDIEGEFGLTQYLIPMRPLMVQIEDHDPSIQVWIIDACRVDPYASGGRPFLSRGGLEKFGEKPNTFVFFAADYSQVARDTLPNERKKSGLGSPFSRTFVKLFDYWKDKDVNLFASQLRRDVVALVRPDPQFPVFENGVLDQWCFTTCDTGVQRIDIAKPDFFSKGPNGVVTSSYTPKAGGEKDTGPDYAALVGDQPVVFLGKESSGNCVSSTVSDLYPFGCSTLKRLVEHFNSGSKNVEGGLVGHSIAATTDVNVRRGLPRPGAKGTVYGCKLRLLRQGQSIKLVSTVALKYAGDTFYWGIVKGIPLECATS
jgi:hypothetical protein